MPRKISRDQHSKVSEDGRGGTGTVIVPPAKRAERSALTTRTSSVDYEIAEPRADSLIESFRGFGYTCGGYFVHPPLYQVTNGAFRTSG